ncbi:hypothetical protein SAFG77S_08043 [Streptomyces afghaniensis]
MNSQYREPGSGAIEFAKQFIEGMTMEEARPVIKGLVKGELHNEADKKVKRCDWCGYYYRDKTKNNRSRVCCRHCKFDKDNYARAIKKAEKELITPKKPRSIEKEMYSYYANHLEYPYYISEHYMLKRAHQREKLFPLDKIEKIEGAKQRGYKRKKTNTPTDGSDRVYVRGLSYKHSYGEVEITHMKPDEINKYFKGKYSEEHLQWERWRAQQFRCSKNLY